MSKKDTETLNAPAQAKSAAAPASAAKKAEKNGTGIYCYIGPNIRGLIQHGAVFRGTRAQAEAAAKAAIEAHPLVKTLIISGDNLPAARLKAKTPGNALYQNCRRIAGHHE